ncbi:(2Fe-2S) ferredoxin domain-containing protein [Chroococcidiopsis sp. FACHB-1243]|uniref:(2Fe-2S) ferredoxin domain-containing protein n=1 Tax=Chroococcidiopsis sp. [FACHB-1243] TaxID=2692781 RepID=UPI00177AD968|nr:(2Fe-2S) ferredoxin domain-containing protein [Chroococcidiopsis sp. [FACHB-1243]]MBD2306679.1 (2Fe-2S) ferredoxin domain-containing protein [Chroococcidiopsis sp. [FACHB-1243]]
MSSRFGKEVSAFSLEGKFLSFELEDGYKRKYLQIGTLEGEYRVKLPKYLRSPMELNLNSGDVVQIFGERKFDYKKDSLKLKAERVIVIDRQPSVMTPATPVKRQTKAKASILVCQKSDCVKRGANGVCKALQASLNERGLENEVEIKATGCLKQCKAGPNVVVMPDKTRYTHVQTKQVAELIDKHFDVDENAHNENVQQLALVGNRIFPVS